MINKYFALTALLLSFCLSKASVVTYPGPADSLKSMVYEVTVFQNGVESTSFVYADANQFDNQKSQMTDWNHWTCFSFSDTITVKVKNLKGTITSCKIYPIIDSIVPIIQGNVLTFTLTQPKKLHLSFGGMYEDPLFIFADEPEVNVPKSTDANVVYWGPGIHEIGEHYNLKSNTTYYIAGGAYIKGSMLSTYNTTNVTIRGRGILSGIAIRHCGYTSCQFDKVAINLPGSSTIKNYIEGITIIDPGMYCIQSYGGCLDTRNVKCFGWWFETDGWVGGDNSKLSDSFFKVYDDVVKLYFKNMNVSNLVIYHQHNGAPFQLGWGSERGTNCTVSDIDIIADESAALGNNHTLLNIANGNTGNLIDNIKLSNIRVDQDLTAIFGLKTNGVCSNIEISDLLVRGRIKFYNYLAYGSFNNIVLRNVKVGSICADTISSIGGLSKTTVKNDEIRVVGCGAPYLSIQNPVLGVSRIVGEWVDFDLAVNDSLNKISTKSVFVDNVKLSDVAVSQNKFTLKNLAIGNPIVKVVGYDAQNKQYASNERKVEVKQSELVCHYRFENNGFDETTRYNGWLNNGDAYGVGKNGLAAIFDGIDDRMTVLNNVFGNMTVAFWIKTTSTAASTGQWINGLGILDGAATGAVNDFGISLYGNSIAVGVGNPDTTIFSTKLINNGNWHHVAVTRNTNTGLIEIYIDGVIEKTGVAAKGYRSESKYFTIGAGQALDRFFKGILDEVMEFNYVLSPAQVFDIMTVTSSKFEHNSNDFLVLSNSSNNGFQLRSKHPLALLEIYDVTGKLIFKKEGVVEFLPNSIFKNKGIYLFKANSIENEHYSKRILVSGI